MPIPHADREVVDIRKLRDYCLIPPTIGVNIKPACSLLRWDSPSPMLKRCVPSFWLVVQTHEAQLGHCGVYDKGLQQTSGSTGRANEPRVRRGWVLEHGSMAPRFIS